MFECLGNSNFFYNMLSGTVSIKHFILNASTKKERERERERERENEKENEKERATISFLTFIF